MIGSASLGPFVYFPVATNQGQVWVRIDQVAAITAYEVILIDHPKGLAIPLADDTEPEDVLHAMRVHLESVGIGAHR